jgi:hypothetical protein
LCCCIRVTSPIFYLPLLTYSWRSILAAWNNPFTGTSKSSPIAGIYYATLVRERVSYQTPVPSQRSQILTIMSEISMASSLAPTGPNLDPTFLPVYSAAAPPFIAITLYEEECIFPTSSGSHDPEFVEVETTSTQDGQSVGTTLPKTSGGLDDHAELSPAKRQKIIHDILSVPFPETDGEESNSCFLETATDLFELFFTLGAIYFTFHIYRSVHSQGFQTESNTSQGRPTIRRFKLASLEDWERHKKLLQELHTEYRQTKLRLENLSDGKMWDFYWVWRDTPGSPRRLECFWAEPASL